MTVEEMLKSAQDYHDKLYAEHEPDYELMPTYLLYKGDSLHTVAVLADMPSDPADRTRLARRMGEEADKAGCDGFVHIAESWTLPAEKVATWDRSKPFAESPDRIELLSLSAGLKAGGEGMVTAKILRSADKPAVLEWGSLAIAGEEGVRMQSRFSLWNQQVPNVTEAERATATGAGSFLAS